MKVINLVIILTVVFNFITEINGHARLMMPIARSSAWRQNPIIFPTFYNDNAMSCGGIKKQWKENSIKS